MNARPFAIVTGASSGIGLELAREAASRGYDLLIAADEPLDDGCRRTARAGRATSTPCRPTSPRATASNNCMQRASGRDIDALLANAGHGLGKGFLDQEFAEVQHVINTNITGTLDLIQKVARQMRRRMRGKILITGSIAGYMPGTFQAVYNGTKAFIDSFSYALRNELKDTRRHGHLPDARRHRHGILRARRPARHQGGHRGEGGSGGRREDRIRCHGEGRGRRDRRAVQQAARCARQAACRTRCWPSSTARWPSPARRDN